MSSSDPHARAVKEQEPSVWSLSVDGAHPARVTTSGSGLVVEEEGKGQSVYALLPAGRHLLLTLDDDGAQIFVPGGGVLPVFARCQKGTLSLSNVASRLMVSGEVLDLDGFVFLQNLSGTPYPCRNIFSDIQLLQASGRYAFRNGRLTYAGTLLAGAAAVSAEDALDMVIAQLDPLFATGRPVAVLLSGGYDSRLNLAIALSLAQKHGNQVKGFHEYKDEAEATIARAVAQAAGVPLEIKTREDFVSRDRPVFFDETFIDVQSGFYRENLLRWHPYLSWIRDQMPDCLILGLGAEAHKGKYYKQVLSLDKDSEPVFGIKPRIIQGIADGLGVSSYDRHAQTNYFKELVQDSRAFSDHTGSVDFIHYQTYIVNGYGQRGHDLAQYFGLAFPFLDNAFLRAVFCMKREEKEGFAIVEAGIKRLAPALVAIPYTSANAKSLLPKKKKKMEPVKDFLAHCAGSAFYALRPPARKGRQTIADSERQRLEAITPRSEVTTLLKDVLVHKKGLIPFAQVDYLLQGLFYLEQCERTASVSFRLR